MRKSNVIISTTKKYSTTPWADLRGTFRLRVMPRRVPWRVPYYFRIFKCPQVHSIKINTLKSEEVEIVRCISVTKLQEMF